jgi:hypothetical protein
MKYEVYFPECYSESSELRCVIVRAKKEKLLKSEKDLDIYPSEAGIISKIKF